MKTLSKYYGNFRSALWKNFKAAYYVKGFIRLYTSFFIRKVSANSLLKRVSEKERQYIHSRLNYYNKLESKYSMTNEYVSLRDFKYIPRLKNYFFDTFQYSRFFVDKYHIAYAFGDVIHIPLVPSIVKSRPIKTDNKNSIVLKLDKVRHFVFVNDKRKFEDKKFKLLWRGNVFSNQTNRLDLLDKFYDSPLCDVGCVNIYDGYENKKGEKLSLYEHLKYQFILSLEGNDVATNLKWIMSSNSIAVMPKPKYETWFMEGQLIPDYHYILVKDDFSDLIEKITYYHEHPEEAKSIIQNANAYVRQFKNKKREKLISLLVLNKYFELQQ